MEGLIRYGRMPEDIWGDWHTVVTEFTVRVDGEGHPTHFQEDEEARFKAINVLDGILQHGQRWAFAQDPDDPPVDDAWPIPYALWPYQWQELQDVLRFPGRYNPEGDEGQSKVDGDLLGRLFLWSTTQEERVQSAWDSWAGPA